MPTAPIRPRAILAEAAPTPAAASAAEIVFFFGVGVPEPSDLTDAATGRS